MLQTIYDLGIKLIDTFKDAFGTFSMTLGDAIENFDIWWQLDFVDWINSWFWTTVLPDELLDMNFLFIACGGLFMFYIMFSLIKWIVDLIS